MKSYLVTDPKYYTDNGESFCSLLEGILARHRPDFALYRDKPTQRYAENAALFLDTCRSFPAMKTMLHGDAALAAKLKADGVHLTSQQFDDIEKAKALGLFVVISCHSEAELLEAQRRGSDAVTYSPIFRTPGKGEPKGLEDLQHIVDKISLPIIALGGITTPEQVKAVEKCGAYGFASIRYFIDN